MNDDTKTTTEQGPVVRKLSQDTKRIIREVLRSNSELGPPADVELNYHYIVGLLENQWPEFWEER